MLMMIKDKPVLLVAVFCLCTSGAFGGDGSIWKARGGATSMFADQKASGVGDIVTIVVQETSQVSSAQETRTNKDTSVESQINKFIFSPEAGGIGDSIAKDGELPGLDWESMNQFNGGGEISNRQVLNARAAVMVIDVLPNGNLLLEGVRITSFSDQTQYAVLRGFIRPQDIRADNTVASTNIADARVEFISEGTLTDSQRKGWLSRLHDKLNPF